MPEERFDAANYAFKWTPPTDPNNHFDLGWYEWDRAEAIKQAMAVRNERAAELKRRGIVAKKSARKGYLTRGGIGSGHPEISLDSVTYVLRY